MSLNAIFYLPKILLRGGSDSNLARVYSSQDSGKADRENPNENNEGSTGGLPCPPKLLSERKRNGRIGGAWKTLDFSWAQGRNKRGSSVPHFTGVEADRVQSGPPNTTRRRHGAAGSSRHGCPYDTEGRPSTARPSTAPCAWCLQPRARTSGSTRNLSMRASAPPPRVGPENAGT